MQLSIRNLILLVVLTGLLINCAKWKVSPYDLIPQVSTGTAGTPATTSVSVQAQIDDKGTAALQEFGIVYSSTNKDPKLPADSKMPATGTSASTAVTLPNLQPNTTYYYRTYATNDKGQTGYGEVKSFTTAQAIPNAQTLDVISTSATSAQVQVQVTNTKEVPIREYGAMYSPASQTPVANASDTKVVTASGTDGSKATVMLANLLANTSYNYRAYAISITGTYGYGDVKPFKTGEPPAKPETLDPVGTPTSTSALVQVQVSNAGEVSLKEYGVIYSNVQQNQSPLQGTKVPTQGTGNKASVPLTNLTPGTTYYYQAYAQVNSGNLSYGEIKSFTTTTAAIAVEALGLVGTPASASAQVQVQVTNASTGNPKEYGIVYSATNQQPTTTDGKVTAMGSGTLTTVTLSGLQPNTTYNYRAYAINSANTPIYSSTVKTFKTQNGWFQIAAFPGTARAETGVIVIGSKAYIIGGLTGIGSTTPTNEVWEYDATTNKWTPKNPLPSSYRIAYGKGFTYNGLGYLVGYTDEARNTYGELLVYNPSTDQWTQRTNTALKRILINLTVIGNKAYIAGGETQSSIIEYNIDANTTRMIAATPLADLFVGVMFPNGARVYIGNGLFYKINSQTQGAYEFSPAEGDKLANKPDMPQTRMMGGVIANNRTFAIGTTDSRLFEFKSDQWSLVDTPATVSPRGGGAFFSIGNTIYYGFGYTNFPSNLPTDRKTDMWSISF